MYFKDAPSSLKYVNLLPGSTSHASRIARRPDTGQATAGWACILRRISCSRRKPSGPGRPERCGDPRSHGLRSQHALWLSRTSAILFQLFANGPGPPSRRAEDGSSGHSCGCRRARGSEACGSRHETAFPSRAAEPFLAKDCREDAGQSCRSEAISSDHKEEGWRPFSKIDNID